MCILTFCVHLFLFSCRPSRTPSTSPAWFPPTSSCSWWASGRSTLPVALSGTSNSVSPAKTRTSFSPTTGPDNAAHQQCAGLSIQRSSSSHTHIHWRQRSRSVKSSVYLLFHLRGKPKETKMEIWFTFGSFFVYGFNWYLMMRFCLKKNLQRYLKLATRLIFCTYPNVFWQLSSFKCFKSFEHLM